MAFKSFSRWDPSLFLLHTSSLILYLRRSIFFWSGSSSSKLATDELRSRFFEVTVDDDNNGAAAAAAIVVVFGDDAVATVIPGSIAFVVVVVKMSAAVVCGNAGATGNDSGEGWAPVLFRTVHLKGGLLRPGGVNSKLIVRGLREDGTEQEGLGKGADDLASSNHLLRIRKSPIFFQPDLKHLPFVVAYICWELQNLSVYLQTFWDWRPSSWTTLPFFLPSTTLTLNSCFFPIPFFVKDKFQRV